MFAKQALIDLGLVLLVPIFVVGGYFVWGGAEDSALLSELPPTQIGPNEPGAKTKLALDTLRGISLDDSLFKDEAFTSLTEFSVPILEVPLARPNPFVPPPVIEDMLRQARLGGDVSKTPTKSSGPTANTQNLSSKIDQLKKSVTGGK